MTSSGNTTQQLRAMALQSARRSWNLWPATYCVAMSKLTSLCLHFLFWVPKQCLPSLGKCDNTCKRTKQCLVHLGEQTLDDGDKLLEHEVLLCTEPLRQQVPPLLVCPSVCGFTLLPKLHHATLPPFATTVQVIFVFFINNCYLLIAYAKIYTYTQTCLSVP